MKMTHEEWVKWYGTAKELHICPACGKEKAAPGKIHCPNCLDAQAVSQMKKRAKMSPEEWQEMSRKNGERLKAKYYEAKKNGLCVTCYKNTPVPGKYSCQRCLNRQREYNKRKREVKE